MIPIQLKLTSLRHCYIQLPALFRQTEQSIKPGSIVSIKSVQSDNELFVLWNGQTSSSSDYVELDFTFAQANNFSDELVVICFKNDKGELINAKKCHSCRVELLNNKEYNIISQHHEINLLDCCKLINIDLVIPIWVSQNVSITVKVVNIQPHHQYALLTEWTEMLFTHSLDNIPKESYESSGSIKKSQDKNCCDILDPIPFVSCSLGVNYKLKFHLGSTLICGEKGSGKTYLLNSILNNKYKQFNSKLFNCLQLRGKRSDNIKKIFNEMLNQAFEEQPYILGLDDIDSFLYKNPNLDDEKGQEAIYSKKLVDIFCHMLKQLERNIDHPRGINVLIIATSKSLDKLDTRISNPKGRQYFNKIIKIQNPSLLDRVNIIKNIIKEKGIKSNLNDIQLNSFCKSLNNYTPHDLKRIVEIAIMRTSSRDFDKFNSEPLEIIEQDLLMSIEDDKPSNLRNVSLKPKSSIRMKDVGGMNHIKEVLLNTILLQIKYPNLFKKCPLKTQSSILLYGPPGCGKTLLAEALTNEESLNSICVRGPELLSKYIGASEAAVKDLFSRAKSARPCVIFFDEFESLVSKRGTDSTGVTDRIVNQFLTLMDGVEKLSSGIFIIAASSRPDMIDSAILRPGRLDKHIYCPIPDQFDRHEILKVLCRNIDLDEKSIDLEEWSRKLECFTGADIKSFLYSAQLKALHELKGSTDFTNKSSNDGSISSKQDLKDLKIIVKQDHLIASHNEMEADTSKKHLMLLKKYPKSFKRINKQVVSTRATLA